MKTPQKCTLTELLRMSGGRKFAALHYPTRRLWTVLGVGPAGKFVGWPINTPDMQEIEDTNDWIQTE